MRRLPIILLALILSGATVMAAAQSTRYVSDTLQVPLRAGTSTRYKILRMIPSGTELAVVRQDTDSGYSLVKTTDGLQGWILSRYLMDAPSARDTLDQALEKVAPLEAENASLQDKLQALVQAKEDIEAEMTRYQADNRRISQELAQIRKTAANAIAIDEQNRDLQERMVNLERELQLVQQENRSLSDRSAQQWFLMGAGVLIGGMVLGLLLPRLRLQKKAHWGDL